MLAVLEVNDSVSETGILPASYTNCKRTCTRSSKQMAAQQKVAGPSPFPMLACDTRCWPFLRC